jgi:DNA polymerase (family X)
MADPLNTTIAARFDEVALLLEQQDASIFRIMAYRRAAEVLRALPKSAAEILREDGLEGLERLPGIGTSLSRSIRALVTTGRFPLLDQLRGENEPKNVLKTMPGIGDKLSEKLHEELGINSLEDLEMAAFDGRLKTLAGFGEKRIAGIRDVLARRLGRMPVRAPAMQQPPSVEELLDVDREYRKKAASGALRKIAPRRFNPKGEAWLPVLHTRRGIREYTALYSNTGRAHQLGMTRDWVVIYCHVLEPPAHTDGRERTFTVVTARRGPLKDLRVVRGRENECIAYYEGIQQLEK